MTVRRASPYTTPAIEVGGVRPEGADASASSGRARGAASEAGPSSDRVELSAAGRQAADAAARAHDLRPEVEEARVALRAQPGLSHARANELRARVADGYYDRPESMAAVAKSIASDLLGGPEAT